MSFTLVREGGLEPPETTELTTTDATTVFTGSDKYIRTVETIALANVDTSNAVQVTLRWVDSTPTSRVFWFGEVAAKSTTIIDSVPVLVDGKGRVRSITAQASSGSDIHVTVLSSAQTKQEKLGAR